MSITRSMLFWQCVNLDDAPQVPADGEEAVAALSDDAIAEFIAAASAFGASVTDEELAAPGVAARLTELADAREYLQAELGHRTERRAAAAAEASAARDRLNTTASATPPATATGTPAPPAVIPSAAAAAAAADAHIAEQVNAALVAAGIPVPSATPGLPPLPGQRPAGGAVVLARTATPALRPTPNITAAADLPNNPGSQLHGLREIAEAIVDRRGMFRGTHTGPAEWVRVATARAAYPEDRIVSSSNTARVNADIIRGTSGLDVTAAGGICAPVDPWYELMVLSGAQRPVRDGMAQYMADRGGIKLIPPPQLTSVGPQARTVSDGATTNGSNQVGSVAALISGFDKGATITGAGIAANTTIVDINQGLNTFTISNNATVTAAGVTLTITRPGAIGYVTAAADAAALGGSAAQIAAAIKPCLHVLCGGAVEYDVAAVTRCLEIGNFLARTFPEDVEAWLKLMLAQHARVAETQLLNFMAANSTPVTQSAQMGIARDIPATLIKAAEYLRQHHRMAPETRFEYQAPRWLIGACAVDLMRGSQYHPDYYTRAAELFQEAFDEAGVTPHWYEDSGTAKGQYFNSGNAQTAGALTAFPANAVQYLYPSGGFVFLDGGELNFGIIRDATLISQNNYRVFGETFEAAAFVAPESLEITSAVTFNTGGFPGAVAAASAF